MNYEDMWQKYNEEIIKLDVQRNRELIKIEKTFLEQNELVWQAYLVKRNEVFRRFLDEKQE